jgi:hypothetical protein
MTNKVLNELTLKEIQRLVNKGRDNWKQTDYDSVYLLLGMLAGKVSKEKCDDK